MARDAGQRQDIEPDLEHLGRYLLAARRKQGLNQRELARRCGLDQAHISRLERGRNWPTLATWGKLAEALGVPWQWFLNGATQPGDDWRDLAIELYHLGIVDLLVADAAVPGAFRPPEQVLALVLARERVEPRIVEALPAVLAWNPWNLRLVEAYAYTYAARAAHRIAWLADVTCIIHSHEGFPGGCLAPWALATLTETLPPPPHEDSLGYPADGGTLPPVSKRWKVTYAATLDTFRRRAEHLRSLKARTPDTRGGPPR